MSIATDEQIFSDAPVTRMRIGIRVGLFAAGAVLLLLSAHPAGAQPAATIKRVTVNWPAVDVYFTPYCAGKPTFGINAGTASASENGLNKDFELICPDPSSPCRMAVSLVLDASGSMSGAYNRAAKAAATAFIDSLDGVADKAALVWFNNAVAVARHPTTDTSSLRHAVDSLPAYGGTALWDGLYIGLLQLLSDSSNACKAVLLLTDGTDNASTTPMPAVLEFAERNRIRVFMVGIGPAVDHIGLKFAAERTGGASYNTNDENELPGIFREVAGIIRRGFLECRLSYLTACRDGGAREVKLSMNLQCGAVTAATDFTAPKNSADDKPLIFRLGDALSAGDEEIVVPLWMEGPEIEFPEVLYPATFDILLDSALGSITGISAPAACVFEGSTFKLQRTAAGARVEIESRTVVRATALPQLAALIGIHTGGHKGPDTLRGNVVLSEWNFSAGCRFPLLRDGELSVLPRPPLLIAQEPQPERMRWDCWSDGYEPDNAVVELEIVNHGGGTATGATARLFVPPGTFEFAQPSSPEQPLSPEAIPPGGKARALWRLRTLPRHSLDTVRLRIQAAFANHPSVETAWTAIIPPSHPALPLDLDGPPFACENIGRILSASPGFAGYIWSTGANTSSIHATRSGTYWYTAITEAGDRYCSDTVGITWRPAPVPLIAAGGSLTFCGGDSLRLSTLEEYDQYSWSTGETTPSIYVRKPDTYRVRVVDFFGCEGVSEPVTTLHHPSPMPAIAGASALCRFDTATYAVANDSGWASRWTAEHGIIEGPATGPSVKVRWGNSPRGMLTVTAVSPVTGCAGRGMMQVFLSPGVNPRVSPGNLTLCRGDTVMLTADTGFVSWLWSDGATTRERKAWAAGPYAVEVVDEQGCRAVSDSIYITINDPPAPSIIGPDDLCRGDTAYYISAPTAGNEYSWTIDGGRVLARPSPWLIQVFWNDATEGRVILQEQAGSCAESDTHKVSLRSGRTPAVVPSASLSCCEGDSVEVTAEAGFLSYLWSTGESTRRIIIRRGGAYIVRVSEGPGCPGWSDSIRVSVIPRPDKPVVHRNSDVLSTGPAAHYRWLLDGAYLANDTSRSLRISRPGIYEVEIADITGCFSRSDPFEVTVLSIAGAERQTLPGISVYPDPNAGLFTVVLTGLARQEITLRVRDALGRSIVSERHAPASGVQTFLLDLGRIPSGIYSIEAESGSKSIRTRTVISRRP